MGRGVDQDQVLCSQLCATPSGSGEAYKHRTPHLPDNKCPTLSLKISSCFSCPLGALRHWGNPFTHFLLCPCWGDPGIDHCRGPLITAQPLTPSLSGTADGEWVTVIIILTPTSLGTCDLITWRNFPSEKHLLRITKDYSPLLRPLLWALLASNFSKWPLNPDINCVRGTLSVLLRRIRTSVRNCLDFLP